MRKFFKYLGFGISWGCLWFVVLGLLAQTFGWNEMFNNMTNQFTQSALASIAIGIAFGTTPIVYTFERLQLWQQLIIHLGVGAIVFFPLALSLGWMPITSVGMMVV